MNSTDTGEDGDDLDGLVPFLNNCSSSDADEDAAAVRRQNQLNDLAKRVLRKSRQAKYQDCNQIKLKGILVKILVKCSSSI